MKQNIPKAGFPQKFSCCLFTETNLFWNTEYLFFIIPISLMRYICAFRVFCTRHVHFYLHMNLFHFVDFISRRREMFRVAHDFARCFSSGHCFVRAHETRSIRKKQQRQNLTSAFFYRNFFRARKNSFLLADATVQFEKGNAIFLLLKHNEIYYNKRVYHVQCN